MLLNSSKSSVGTVKVKLWRYLYKIPPSMEIRVPTTHERVDWVMSDWVAIYELMLKDGIRFPIPKLIRDMCDHYEIAPSQLIQKTWMVLMSLESLSIRHRVECKIREFSSCIT